MIESSGTAIESAGTAEAIDALEAKLGPALHANRQGSTTDHVLLVLPSYSVGECILSHYNNRIKSLEHRYLNALLISARIPSCEIVYVSTVRPEPGVLEYYASIMRDDMQDEARFQVFDVDDGSLRPVATKLIADPTKLHSIRELIRGRPALIEAWNVTDQEMNLALALDVPINGTRPSLRQLGFKGAGRRLFREASVPLPVGVEDVRTVDDVVAGIGEIQARRPDVASVVIKHDDSASGDGNQVVDLTPGRNAADPSGWLRSRIEALPEWYLGELQLGGIVEERIAGSRFSSPSAQIDILPDGSVDVLATHEQVLGGDDDQIYLGCRFPAEPVYAPELARHARAIGTQLARAGALGRVAIDFVAAADDAGRWSTYAIEINLRKGGTSHPYSALRNLIPGHYDAERGAWVAAEDGSTRCYAATDNLVNSRWLGLDPAIVIDGIRNAGLIFTHESHTGAVLHMLSGLAIDGRFGLTAIGCDQAEASEIQAGVEEVMDLLCGA